MNHIAPLHEPLIREVPLARPADPVRWPLHQILVPALRNMRTVSLPADANRGNHRPLNARGEPDNPSAADGADAKIPKQCEWRECGTVDMFARGRTPWPVER